MSPQGRIDLNADLGEQPGPVGERTDEQLLSIVSSANVATGGHAGDRVSMRRVSATAAEQGVRIGAHLSYPDREGFGRRAVSMEPAALLASLRQQLAELQEAADAAGTAVSYIKPHGALYNTAAVSDAPAAILVEVAEEHGLPLLTLPEGRLAQLASQAGLPTYAEFFADRAYDPDGRLRSRSRVGSVIDSDAAVVERVVNLVRTQSVVAHDGTVLQVTADSICLHGDTPGAVALSRRVRETLLAERITITTFLAGDG